MGTISEKILSAHAGKEVRAGDICIVPVDFMMSQDGTTGLTIKAFKQMAAKAVANPKKYAIVIDHNSPSPMESVSNIHKEMRDFANDQGSIIYDVGEGVCHQLLPEKGHVLPGNVVIGGDSHTCTYGALNVFATGVGSTDLAAALVTGKTWFRVPSTIKFVYDGILPEGTHSKDVILHMCKTLTSRGATYKALEIYGTVIDSLSVDARMTISNMVVEVGAKVGLMPCDGRVREYVRQRTNAPFKGVEASGSAIYERVIREDLSDLPPQVAKPHEVDNVVDVSQVTGTELDQVYIGTCTNGRLEDLRIASEILAGKKVARGVRLIVAPASRNVLLDAMREGYIDRLVRAGATVIAPSCGPCVGTCNGVPSDAETVLSTANRNFKGRMGNTKAEIYLSSPATAAYSAMLGHIADIREVQK
ncbi:MAG: 3-isopropylmalate dehydratase large subunit [Methanomassiliicoccus sp.]|jgi:3-isopropylmalate/(R)-2-methylmalate dehydratase large subunit|nr:3-isopropylmalate dehydratase large subunit [Methanomassiliicoccus sp.]